MNQADPTRPIEILLVEDNPGDARLTREALLKGKVRNTLAVVDDGVNALAYLRGIGEYRNSKRPDVVLLDLTLPKKDGREVLVEIKSDPKLQSIPVVILTGSQAEEDILKAYNLNVTSYLTKPIDMDKLIKALQNVDDFWFTIVKVSAR